MHSSLETEKNELFSSSTTKSEWKKWFLFNLKNPQNDLCALIEYMLSKIKKKNRDRYKRIMKKKFFEKVFFEINEISALAVFYKKACKYDEIPSFPKIVKNKVELIKNNDKEKICNFFFFKDHYFDNISRLKGKNLGRIRNKINKVLDQIDIDDFDYSYFNSKKDLLHTKIWIFWLALYENNEIRVREQLDNKNFLFDLTIESLKLKNDLIDMSSLTSILNDFVFPLLITNEEDFIRNIILFLELLPFKVFKEYIKKMKIFIPEDEEILDLFQNILKNSYTPNSLLYVTKVSEMLYAEGKTDILKYVAESYLYIRFFECLMSEKYFYETMELISFYLLDTKINPNFNLKLDVHKAHFRLINEYIQKFFQDKDLVKKTDNLLLELSKLKQLKLNNQKSDEKAKNTKNSQEIKDNKITKPEVKLQKSKKQIREESVSNFNSQKDTQNISRIYNTTKAKIPYRGLRNLGNTCYMNSFIQSLFLTLGLKAKLFEIKYDNQPSLVKELITLFRNLTIPNNNSNNNLESLSPYSFKKRLPADYDKSENQEDVFMFGTAFFDCIEELYKEDKFKFEESFFEDLFKSKFESRVKCFDCDEISTNIESHWMIRINVKAKEKNDLGNLIRLAFQNTFLQNEVVCEKCNKKSEVSEKSYHIKKLPPYLLISMNLIYYDNFNAEPKKIIEIVNPLIEMDIVKIFKEIKSEKNPEIFGEYNLYSIIIHKGATPNSGHYYSLGRNLNSDDRNWYIFNDSEIVKLSKNLNLKDILQEKETPIIFFFENTKKIGIEPLDGRTIRIDN